MAKMKKFSPKIQSIKERFGDDRQKMNQAMMAMYREEKINPLGGCWPILIQIPVFIALRKTIPTRLPKLVVVFSSPLEGNLRSHLIK